MIQVGNSQDDPGHIFVIQADMGDAGLVISYGGTIASS